MIIRVITDNASAAQGFRLGGMQCAVVSGETELISALKTAVSDKNTAAVFITRGLYDANTGIINEAKKSVTLPVVEAIDS